MEKIKLPKLNETYIAKIQEKTLIEIKNDAFFRDFILQHALNDDEIIKSASKFIRFKEDNLKCQNCKGKCQKGLNQIQMNLVFDEDKREVDIEFNICDFYKKVNALKRMFYRIDFPIDYLEYDFKKELNNDFLLSRESVIKKLQSILVDDSKKGIFLTGNNGIGKTFIFALFAKSFLENKKGSVAFCSSGDIFKEMSDLNFSDKNALNSLLNDLINVDLLVLDGFGDEYKSDFVRDNYVYPLLSARLEKHKLTLFTSNFTIKEVVDMYTLSYSSKPKTKQLSVILYNLADEIVLSSKPFIF